MNYEVNVCVSVYEWNKNERYMVWCVSSSSSSLENCNARHTFAAPYASVAPVGSNAKLSKQSDKKKAVEVVCKRLQ